MLLMRLSISAKHVSVTRGMTVAITCWAVAVTIAVAVVSKAASAWFGSPTERMRLVRTGVIEIMFVRLTISAGPSLDRRRTHRSSA